MRVLSRFGVSLWKTAPATSTSKNTSKKLSAVPSGAKGGRSSRPFWVLAVSSISPRDARRPTGAARRARRVARAGELHRHDARGHLLAAVAVQSASAPRSTSTVVGPRSETTSLAPVGSVTSTTARESGNWSTSIGFGMWRPAPTVIPVGFPFASKSSISPIVSYASPAAGGLWLMRVLSRFGVSLWKTAPATSTSKNTSKKLSAVPSGAKGGRSSRPFWVLAVSSISPRDARTTDWRSTTGPSRSLVPTSSIATMRVGTCSRPLPSESASAPRSTSTVVGPRSDTTSLAPVGSVTSTTARESGNWSISKGAGT